MGFRPENLKNVDDSLLEIRWDDGRTGSISYFDMRLECPCAGCVNEITGERTLKPEDVRKDVKPASVAFVGQYAIRINWSDGHNTGIYTFDRLRNLTIGDVE